MPRKRPRRSSGSGEIQRYVQDPLRGDSRAHGILRLHREGWTDRKIAKRFDVGLAVVRSAIARAESVPGHRG